MKKFKFEMRSNGNIVKEEVVFADSYLEAWRKVSRYVEQKENKGHVEVCLLEVKE